MGRGKLTPVNPLPIAGERDPLFFEADAAAPVALKRYQSSETVLEARVESERVEAPVCVEARKHDQVVLSGPVTKGKKSGEWVARLAIDSSCGGETVQMNEGLDDLPAPRPKLGSTRSEIPLNEQAGHSD